MSEGKPRTVTRIQRGLYILFVLAAMIGIAIAQWSMTSELSFARATGKRFGPVVTALSFLFEKGATWFTIHVIIAGLAVITFALSSAKVLRAVGIAIAIWISIMLGALLLCYLSEAFRLALN